MTNLLMFGFWELAISVPSVGYLRPKPKNISTPKSSPPPYQVRRHMHHTLHPRPSSGTGLGTMDGFCHKDGEEEDINFSTCQVRNEIKPPQFPRMLKLVHA